jgi:hypothetical protein
MGSNVCCLFTISCFSLSRPIICSCAATRLHGQLLVMPLILPPISHSGTTETPRALFPDGPSIPSIIPPFINTDTKMTAQPVAQFENRLSATAGEADHQHSHSHDHDHAEATGHDHATEEHGHTHEHLEHAGKLPVHCLIHTMLWSVMEFHDLGGCVNKQVNSQRGICQIIQDEIGQRGHLR